jgi:Cu(I)/Ag(I) efflux system membrane fusion protein
VVSAYDTVRGSLAQDRSDVSAQALTLADAAQAAAASAPDRLRRPLEDLAGASRRLAGLEGNDLAGARSAFGDASRALISVLSAEPSLQQGRHVYECPMARGYKKWVQVAEEASNPYMGREMLQCGTEIAF